MRRGFFLCLVLLISFWGISLNSFSTTYYVSKSGKDTNDGTTWTLSLLKVKTALTKAKSGDSIWIAEGTYKEGETIKVNAGVSVYGGFAGTENSLDTRDMFLHKSRIDGNGAYLCMENSGSIDGLYIQYGKATSNPGGIYNKSGTVTNCVIIYNVGSFSGGIESSGGLISNCVISGNSATNDFYSGGVYLYSGIITNCVIAGNTGIEKGGVYNNSGKIYNSIIWNNTPCDYKTLNGSISHSCFIESDGTNNNTNLSPCFISMASTNPFAWDIHLKNGSPCIDSGDPSVSQMLSLDMEKRPRPGPDGKVCMGPFESPDEYLPGIPETDTIYVSPAGNDSNGQNWTNAYKTISKAITAAKFSANTAIVKLAAGTYKEKAVINVSGRLSLSGGWSGNSSSPDERDIIKYKTIVDGEKSYPCFVNYGSLDGLYIQNGNNTNSEGAGVYNTGTITKCVVSNCIAYRDGGGIYNEAGSIIECEVKNNNSFSSGYSSISGGGVYNNRGKVYNCLISGNYCSSSYTSASSSGGGITNALGEVVNCSVISNSISAYSSATPLVFGQFAHSYGGGISNSGIIRNCIVSLNSASASSAYPTSSTDTYGGGIHNTGTISNCLVTGNTATAEENQGFGGGIYNSGNITNCSITANSAALFGSGVYNTSGNVKNSIICDNVDDDYYFSENGVISYSCFKEAENINGNINQNPMFIDVSDSNKLNWNLRLQIDSPCVDSGTTDSISVDFSGIQRPQGDKWDMGAYECLYQDINADSKIDNSDADIIGNYLNKTTELSDSQKLIADINKDGKIDISDVVFLFNIIESKNNCDKLIGAIKEVRLQ